MAKLGLEEHPRPPSQHLLPPDWVFTPPHCSTVWLIRACSYLAFCFIFLAMPMECGSSLGQGLNWSHSSSLSHGSDKTKPLTTRPPGNSILSISGSDGSKPRYSMFSFQYATCLQSGCLPSQFAFYRIWREVVCCHSSPLHLCSGLFLGHIYGFNPTLCVQSTAGLAQCFTHMASFALWSVD